MEPVKHPPLTNRLLAPLIILILACNVLAWSQQESPLYSFRLSGNDGLDPIAGLVSDNLGNLYGTTPWGGIYHDGTIFELSPPSGEGALWSEAILSNFTGGTDGSNPSSPVILDSLGNLYGTTSSGGLTGVGCSSTGCGVVFELSPPSRQGGSWTYTVLYRFSSPGPYYPIGGMVLDETGNLYGTTKSGGAAGAGTVFELSPPAQAGASWNKTVLYSFPSPSAGYHPFAGLTLGGSGILYGTTTGDVHGPRTGAVFQLASSGTSGAPWAETPLHSFYGPDGGSPYGPLLLDAKGNLYGTTTNNGDTTDCVAGCGTIFKFIAPVIAGGPWQAGWNIKLNGTDGDTPVGNLVIRPDNTIYGVTTQGGQYGYGTVYQVQP